MTLMIHNDSNIILKGNWRELKNIIINFERDFESTSIKEIKECLNKNFNTYRTERIKKSDDIMIAEFPIIDGYDYNHWLIYHLSKLDEQYHTNYVSYFVVKLFGVEYLLSSICCMWKEIKFDDTRLCLSSNRFCAELKIFNIGKKMIQNNIKAIKNGIFAKINRDIL